MTRPLALPLYVVILSSDADRPRAIELASRMEELDHTVFIDDFDAPINEAFRAMWDRDYKLDYGDPRNTNGLMLEAKQELTESQILASLRSWFHTIFGAETLGKMAHKRARDQQTITEYIYTFRDGILDYMVPFVTDAEVRRELLIVQLSPQVPAPPPLDPHPCILVVTDPAATSDDIILLMEGAWKGRP